MPSQVLGCGMELPWGHLYCMHMYLMHQHPVNAVHAHGIYMPTPAAAKLGPPQQPRPFYIIILLGGIQIGGFITPIPSNLTRQMVTLRIS